MDSNRLCHSAVHPLPGTAVEPFPDAAEPVPDAAEPVPASGPLPAVRRAHRTGKGERSVVALLLVLGALVAGCEGRYDTNAIERGSASWAGAMSRADLEGVTRWYERGGVVLPPGGDAVVTRASIEAHWRGLFQRYEVQFEREVEDLDADGRIGYVYGTYRIQGVDPAGADRFQVENRFIQVWRRQRDGTWRIALDVWHPPARQGPGIP